MVKHQNVTRKNEGSSETSIVVDLFGYMLDLSMLSTVVFTFLTAFGTPTKEGALIVFASLAGIVISHTALRFLDPVEEDA